MRRSGFLQSREASAATSNGSRRNPPADQPRDQKIKPQAVLKTISTPRSLTRDTARPLNRNPLTRAAARGPADLLRRYRRGAERENLPRKTPISTRPRPSSGAQAATLAPVAGVNRVDFFRFGAKSIGARSSRPQYPTPRPGLPDHAPFRAWHGRSSARKGGACGDQSRGASPQAGRSPSRGDRRRPNCS